MTRVLCVSSASGAALLAAARDAGAIGAGRLVLLVANEAQLPEITADPRECAGFGAVAAFADSVLSWNDLIAPLHPSAWRPPQPEIPVLSRLLATRLAPADEVEELLVESITEGPGRTLAALVPDVPITLLSHSLAAYGPPVRHATSEPTERVSRLLYVDLVPTLRPLLLPHAGVAAEAVPVERFRAALAPLGQEHPALDAVLLGERYAERGMLSGADEHSLRINAVQALAAAGRRRVVFAPHPSAAPQDYAQLVDAAAAAGVQLSVGPAGYPHEAWAIGQDALVVGTSQTALFLAADSATFGCRLLIDRPWAYDHPDRMPLVISDVLLPQLEATGAVTAPPDLDLQHLVDAVAFLVAPSLLASLRDRAADWAVRNGTAPYLRRKRLESLGVAVGSPGRRAGSAQRQGLSARARGWLAARTPRDRP